MSSALSSNPFFDALPKETADYLSKHCVFRRYAKGQRLNYRYWEKLTAILDEGLMVFGDYDESGNFVTSGIGARGVLVSPGTLVDIWQEPAADRDIICLLECSVAIFDTEVVQRLFQTDMAFVHTIYGNIHKHCSMEKHMFLKNIGGRDSYAAVRYVLDWCRKHNIPPLTHREIALICNRSRPTVTEIMHTLLKQEPELFLSPDACDTPNQSLQTL